MAQTAIAQFAVRFDGPEMDWIAPAPPNQLLVNYGGVSEKDDIPQQLAYSVRMVSLRTLIRVATVERMRLRILDIHASQILAFQWRHARLPKTLEEVAKGLSADPLTGHEFQYSVLHGGGYDLFSQGTPESGPIRLIPNPPSPDPNRQQPP